MFAGASVNTATNHTVSGPVMWVFCTAAVTVTLPAAASTNRPITVAAVVSQSGVVAAGGSVHRRLGSPDHGRYPEWRGGRRRGLHLQVGWDQLARRMTYQNLGYWVGQANDLSTGAHPTGWANGQRWSETATEWQAMYDQAASDRDLLEQPVQRHARQPRLLAAHGRT